MACFSKFVELVLHKIVLGAKNCTVEFELFDKFAVYYFRKIAPYKMMKSYAVTDTIMIMFILHEL